MRLNNKGFVIEGAALLIIGIMALFVLPPNPVSNVLGVGIRPNKTIETRTEKILPMTTAEGKQLFYEDGSPAFKLVTETSNKDIQQKVTFWEWLRSLPIFVLILMGSGVVFPPVAAFLSMIYRGLKKDAKRIVVGVDDALKHVKDDELKKKMLLEMGNRQNESTKNLVDKIQGKT